MTQDVTDAMNWLIAVMGSEQENKALADFLAELQYL